MNIAVVLEYRFARTPDGAVWTPTAFARPFWSRYLEVFEHVNVVARVREVRSAAVDWARADGDGVSFVSVPHYLGPWQYFQHARQVRLALRSAIAPEDAVVLRVGSQLASIAIPNLTKIGHPYGLEVVGDPWDVFAPGAVRHPLRALFRRWFAHQLKGQCAEACAVAYVTESTLQRRYAPAPAALSTHYSSIELPHIAFAANPRRATSDRVETICSLIFVGSLSQIYKCPDILINAVSECLHNGMKLRLVIIGDGKHRAELEAQVEALGLSEEVTFLGEIPSGKAIRDRLDEADLFILPSRTEGLPRAMIEAMARGLPCIGSKVGGIPELLPSEDMVSPGDAKALARKIREVVTDPKRMARTSARNLEKAKEYREEVLRERRMEFYRYLRKKTEEWLSSEGNPI